jgi:serine/threonine protein kinase
MTHAAPVPGRTTPRYPSATESLLGARYRLTERIARGGMGEVWRGTDELLNRVVAIKLLREDLALDSGFLDRFRAEARNTAALSHPGIAAVHDYGEQGGYAYLVMEFIPGEPLAWILSREATLEPDRALRYVGQAALALQTAHDAGVVHRDIKPPNLIVTPNDRVKITDFGIARAVGDRSLTGTGTVMGTAEYLSPEQASGRDATPASDLYALGIVLYESLAGRRPFQGGNPVTVAMAHVSQPPPALPPAVPAPVAGLVHRLLAKEPAQRPVSADSLAREIARLRSTLSSTLRPPEPHRLGPATPAPPPPQAAARNEAPLFHEQPRVLDTDKADKSGADNARPSTVDQRSREGTASRRLPGGTTFLKELQARPTGRRRRASRRRPPLANMVEALRRPTTRRPLLVGAASLVILLLVGRWLA